MSSFMYSKSKKLRHTQVRNEDRIQGKKIFQICFTPVCQLLYYVTCGGVLHAWPVVV